MKQSYFKTPRSYDECTFHSWGNAIYTEKGNQSSGIDGDSVLFGFCIAGLIFIVVYLLLGY